MKKDPDRIDLYYAVAEAINQWSAVEESLSWTFAIATDSHFPHTFGAAFAVYWKARSFATKLEIVDAAVRATTNDPELKEEWVKLQSKLSRKSNGRNEVAHFTISKDTSGRFVLCPFLSESQELGQAAAMANFLDPEESAKKLNEPPKQLDANDVWQRAESFQALSERIVSFNSKLKDYRRIMRLIIDGTLKGDLARSFDLDTNQSSR